MQSGIIHPYSKLVVALIRRYVFIYRAGPCSSTITFSQCVLVSFYLRSAAARGTRTFETHTNYHSDEMCKPMTPTVLGDLQPHRD